MIPFVFLFVPFIALECEAYVLLQVRKNDENSSNIDAIIHKVVPSDQLGNFTANIGQQLLRDGPTTAISPKSGKDALNTERRVIDSEGQLVDSGPDSPSLEDILDVAAAKLSTLKAEPIFRSRVRDRSGKAVVNLRAEDMVGAVEKILSSSLLRKYLDKLSRKAAIALNKAL